MPRKSYAKKNTKKVYKRKTNKKSLVVPRTISNLGKGFPKRLQITHKYNENVRLNSVSGALALWRFSCNALFDPNITGGGHKPMYFNQLAAIYDHYCVIGAKIKITIMPDFAVTLPTAYGINVNDDTTVTASTAADFSEQTQSKIHYFTFNNSDPKHLSATWSAKKFFGGSILANDELQGSATSVPQEQSYFVLYLQAVDQISTASAYAAVDVEYITIWKELKDIAGS